MDSVMGDALAEQRFSVVLFAGFALLALVLVAIGLYGVMAQAVAARTREMGVRIALGARPSAVRRLVVMQGAALLGAGLAVGLPAALVSARLLGTLLYGVSPSDPLTTAAVVSAIAAVTILAAYVPARRATRVDPAVVLRGD
jgi:ABC-type antimicrobial peptide transport system permease subunit